MKTSFHFFLLLILTAVILIIFPFSLSAQETIEVKNSTAQMSKGSQPVYSAEIPLASLKDVQAAWTRRLQENIKTKVTDNKGELTLANVVKTEITQDTISLYTILIEKEDRILMNVFLESDSVFFSPNNDKTALAAEKVDNSLRNYIRKFAVEQYRQAATLKLESEQDLLKTRQDELEKLVKEEENLKKENSSLENEIEKTEREITSLDQEIELKNQELNSHKTSMLSIVLEEEKKAAADKDKDLEKEKKKLEKERQGLRDDISGMKSEISGNNDEIEESEKAQEAKKDEITAQTTVVSEAQAYLNGIK
jgi:chromosome segregation ATPase